MGKRWTLTGYVAEGVGLHPHEPQCIRGELEPGAPRVVGLNLFFGGELTVVAHLWLF